MPAFTRSELDAGLAHYQQVVEKCTETGDWAPFADLFTEDCTYKEHVYGDMHGREEVRRWIVDVMRPWPHMRFPHTWLAYDEENGAIVMEIRNTLDHPTEPGVEFVIRNVTRLVYAGDGLFSSEEDVYNPHRDTAEVVGWLKAGGTMLAEPLPLVHI